MVGVVVPQVEERLLQRLGACAWEADAENLHGAGAFAGRGWGGEGVETLDEGPEGVVQGEGEVAVGVEGGEEGGEGGGRWCGG